MKAVLLLLVVVVFGSAYSQKEGSKLVQDLFKLYSNRVYNKEYDMVKLMYDDNAVLVEKGKKHFYGAENIVDAIKKYHSELGEGKTINYNERFEQLNEDFLYYFSNYKAVMKNSERVLKGSYWQIWRKATDGSWKIIHDEFTIDAEEREN